jgi:hypothetical protein
MGVSAEPFLAFVECAGCHEPFAVRDRYLLNRVKWCSERCRKAQYRTPCAICGKLCGGSDRATYCAGCAQVVTGRIAAERAAPRRALVERLWAEGKTVREICAELGVRYHKSYLASWRERGYDLPYRRSAEALANVRRGNVDGFAAARAARKAR